MWLVSKEAEMWGVRDVNKEKAKKRNSMWSVEMAGGLSQPTERNEHAESISGKYIGYVVFVLPILESGRFMKILDSVYSVL